MRTPPRLLSILLVLVGLQIGRADASPIVYSGVDLGATAPGANSLAAASSFGAAAFALGANNIITFEPPLAATNSPTSQTLALATGVSVTGQFIDIRNTLLCAANLCGGPSGGTQFLEILAFSMTFNFATPINAFGAFFGGLQNTNLGGNETMTFFDGSTQTIVFPAVPDTAGGFGFIGFTDAGASISSVTINVQSGGAGMSRRLLKFSGGSVDDYAIWRSS